MIAKNNDLDNVGDQEISVYIETVTIGSDPIFGGPIIPPGPRIIFPDTDGDGIVDAVDNCPVITNTNQWDTNGDGVGDVCEEPVGAPLYGCDCNVTLWRYWPAPYWSYAIDDKSALKPKASQYIVVKLH